VLADSTFKWGNQVIKNKTRYLSHSYHRYHFDNQVILVAFFDLIAGISRETAQAQTPTVKTLKILRLSRKKSHVKTLIKAAVKGFIARESGSTKAFINRSSHPCMRDL
jgi:hypothetical protein